MAAQLNGVARQSVKLAAEYACERKAFGVAIGTYQALSHPLAEFISAVVYQVHPESTNAT